MSYAKPAKSSKLVSASKSESAKTLWDADKGKLYLNSDGTNTVFYPDGSTCHYPGN